MVEVMKIVMTSLKRSHAWTATVLAPNTAAGHFQPMPSPETLGHPQANLLSPGSWCTRFCTRPLPTCTSIENVQIQFCLSLCGISLVWARFVWALWVSLVGMGLDFKCDTPPTILLDLLLCPWAWGISSRPLQCLQSYWDFSDLGHGVPIHGCSIGG